jgi:glycosyltransferase involved in cell wall biosynthesis
LVRKCADGLVVDPGDADELADANGRLLASEEPAPRLGEAGRRSVQDLTWSRVADQYRWLPSEVAS